MGLNRVIETDEDWNDWEAHLLGVEKEELVQGILARMAVDSRFMNYMYAQFGGVGEEKLIIDSNAQTDAYEQEMLEEIGQERPDAEYLVSLTERFYQITVGMTDYAEQRNALYRMLFCLKKAAERFQSGDEELLLITDEIRDVKKLQEQLLHKESSALRK